MCVCVCVCVCVCLCVCMFVSMFAINGWADVQVFLVMQVFDTVTQSFFDTRKTLYLKELPAELLKTYLKENGNIFFVVI